VAHYDFESKIPVDHVLHIIQTVREDGVLGNTGDILICVGSAVGELGTFIKSFGPAPFGDIAPVMTVIVDEQETMVEGLSLLQVCDELESQLAPKMSGEAPAAINPLLMALIVQLVKRLLAQLI
jgi:hypothetical protein